MLRSALARSVATCLALGAATLPLTADAFCGFYVGGADAKLFNNATQVVLMRQGTRTVLSVAGAITTEYPDRSEPGRAKSMSTPRRQSSRYQRSTIAG